MIADCTLYYQKQKQYANLFQPASHRMQREVKQMHLSMSQVKKIFYLHGNSIPVGAAIQRLDREIRVLVILDRKARCAKTLTCDSNMIFGVSQGVNNTCRQKK